MSAAFAVASVTAKAAELSGAQLDAAHKLYVMKCTKCHERYSPTDYSKAEWDIWMTKMNRKSRVKPAQADLLTGYTELLRTGKVVDVKKSKR